MDFTKAHNSGDLYPWNCGCPRRPRQASPSPRRGHGDQRDKDRVSALVISHIGPSDASVAVPDSKTEAASATQPGKRPGEMYWMCAVARPPIYSRSQKDPSPRHLRNVLWGVSSRCASGAHPDRHRVPSGVGRPSPFKVLKSIAMASTFANKPAMGTKGDLFMMPLRTRFCRSSPVSPC